MWYSFSKSQGKLSGLEAEALKYDKFEDFEYAYIGNIKHGKYWHVTDNPNFQIDLNYSPRDMSSISTGEGSNKGLMITSHLEHWATHYKGDREYAALIDMSAVPSSEYKQVNRGFGNEFWVTPKGAALARVVKVYPLKSALNASRNYQNNIPQNREELKQLWEKVHSEISEEPESIGLSDNVVQESQ
jgi:hypothetical protein